MIHFLVVHWKDDFWIAPQLRQLSLMTKSPYMVHSFFTGIDPVLWQEKFATVEATDEVSHSIKLNRLAQIAESKASGPDDLLVFCDSDCFPIAPWEETIRGHLSRSPLVAVRRDENVGDRQPHPCFAVTTLRTWKMIDGDWSMGKWTTKGGRVRNDVGGKLLGDLRDRGLSWEPLLRSNKSNPHPVLFGIYGGIVYHHGAGSRLTKSSAPVWEEYIKGKSEYWRRIYKAVPNRFKGDIQNWLLRSRLAEYQRLSNELREEIAQDPEFFVRFA